MIRITTPILEAQFDSFMTAGHGKDWFIELNPVQITECTKAFMAGCAALYSELMKVSASGTMESTVEGIERLGDELKVYSNQLRGLRHNPGNN